MFWVYILTNKETGRFYIGSTNDLVRRLSQHKNGSTRTTKILGTSDLVYKEEFKTLEDARSREKKLKSYKSRKYLEWLISNQNQGR